LYTHIDAAKQQFQDAPWIAGFSEPFVGVVTNGKVFVGGDLVAFHDPFDSAFTFEDEGNGLGRDVLDGDLDVVDVGIRSWLLSYQANIRKIHENR
jgi:hypothetical protein